MADLVLVIDDDAVTRGLLQDFLGHAGYQVTGAPGGREGLQLFYAQHPDFVILDVRMPGMDGWAVCQRMREVSDVPLMMLTAEDEERNRLRGFQLGVDDYVVKPFSPAEVVARVRAILERTRRVAAGPNRPPLVCGEVMIDLTQQRVTRAGQPVHLTRTEFRLLAALAEHPGRPLAPEVLLTRVWGGEYADNVDNVKRYIHYLRQKLEDNPQNPQLILNERGFGYFLAEL